MRFTETKKTSSNGRMPSASPTLTGSRREDKIRLNLSSSTEDGTGGGSLATTPPSSKPGATTMEGARCPL